MSSALAPLIYALAFIAVVLLVQTTAGVMFSSQDKTKRINRRLTLLQSGKSRDEVFSTLVRRTETPQWDSLQLTRVRQLLADYSRQAGVTASPERLVLVGVALAGAMWLMAMVGAGRAPTGLALLLSSGMALVASVVLSALGVWLWLRFRRLRRLKRLEEQLPVALDIVNRAIRAGHPVVSAIQLASEELLDPLGSELGLIVDETTYGVEFEQALTNFAHRTGSTDAHYFAVSVSVQAETGGNLAEILDGLAKVIRGRQTLSRRIKSLSSEGRASAILISLMPIFVVCVQTLANPRVYSDKFDDPIFWPAVAVTAVIYLSGWLIVRRIINFRY